MSDELPLPFGRYVLTRLIGEGGMAEVYQASVRVAEGLTKWVVIKKIRADFADDRDFTRMFVDEAKIALSLNHANIVQVFDFGQIRGTFYLAMELIEGLDLMRLFHAVRSQADAFPAVIAAYVGHQVASGLAYAHRKADDYGAALGIVHRDISPHNLMLSFEGQVKILDFGIARTRRAWDAELERVEAETIKGKVAYMSPEQSLGKLVDQRSDLYSLGVVLYELLTGDLLFRTRDRLQALERVRTEAIPPILESAPDLPDELAHIVDKALARDPDNRWASAREMQSALAQFLHRADPVVDDEVLSAFLNRFRGDSETSPTRLRPGTRAHSESSHVETREVAETQHTLFPRPVLKSLVRCVLLQAGFESRPPPGEAPADLRALIDNIRDLAFKREAHIARVDDDGALLVFGTVLTTGDDADRALRVARALRESVAEFAPGTALGVVLLSTHVTVARGDDGKIFVDLPPGLGAQLARVASRVVEDPIMVAGELVERLRRTWRIGESGWLDPQIPEEAAGSPWAADFQRAAPVLGPLSEAELRSQQTWVGRKPLFGRELELKTLRDAFAESIRGPESRSVLVVGAAGLGKRALIDRFVASLPSGACAVLRGVGQWSTRNQALGVFLTLLRRFLRIESDTRLDAIARKLRDYGVPEPDDLAEALSSALGLPDAPDPAKLDPMQRRDRIGRLVRRLIRGLAQRRPVLIVLENLHFVDEQSLRLLEEWTDSRHALPILAVSSTRPGPRGDAFAAKPRVTRIEVRELGPSAAREMILRRFEDPSEAEELADAILARTGGHPLFIEEILASLLHRGAISWNAQAHHLIVRERGAPIELPPSIEGALQARVDELSPDDRETLLGAAVLGRSVRAHELGELLERSVIRNLDSLVEQGLLERDLRGVTGFGEALHFATVSLHDVCKAQLGPGQLEVLHGRAAELKLARPDHVDGRDDGPIADHLMHAGRLEEAVEPAIRAARHAENVAGNVEAYYYLTQALRALGPDDPRRFEVLLEREPILRAWGRRRAQGADIRQLIAVADRSESDDPSRPTAREEMQVVASLRLLRFYLECGRPHRATKLIPRLTAKVHGLDEPEPYLAVLGELESELMFARGHFDEAETIGREALEFCGTDSGGIEQRVRLLRAVGRVQLATGRHASASDTFREALHLARRISHRRLEAEALNSLGEVAGRSTRYQEAIDCFKAALAIDRDLGDRFATGTKLANLGLAYTAIGLYRRAERYLRKALELHEAIGHPGLLNDVMVSLGVVVARLGDPDAARTLLIDAANVAARRGDSRTQLRAEVRLARILITTPVDQDGEPRPSDQAIDEAKAIAERVLEQGRTEGLRSAAARAAHVLSAIAARRTDIDRAIALERDAVKMIRAGAAPLDGVRSLHHLGLLLRARGNEAEARSLLAEAADAVQTRLDDLRDQDLRDGYQQLPDVRRILADGGRF